MVNTSWDEAAKVVTSHILICTPFLCISSSFKLFSSHTLKYTILIKFFVDLKNKMLEYYTFNYLCNIYFLTIDVLHLKNITALKLFENTISYTLPSRLLLL